jgi:drug/metabolite transporter (DMT)-like permease
MISGGIILCFVGAISFGVDACFAKVAERQNCRASALVASLFSWAAVFMLVRTFMLGARFRLPAKAVGVAVVLGICAAVAILAFQTSISFGKVTVAWLVMNLSAGVPALVSIWVYRERVTPLLCTAFAVALVALVCLFQGKRMEGQSGNPAAAERSERLMWFLLMLIILLTNGMSSFGLKVIAAWGLPASETYPYLTVWYAAGFACITVAMLVRGNRVSWKELGWGAAMAILSIGGQVAMAIALGSNVPGNVVFPITIGGGILVVVVAGRLFFGERMNRMSAAGVTMGFAAVILLSMS